MSLETITAYMVMALNILVATLTLLDSIKCRLTHASLIPPLLYTIGSIALAAHLYTYHEAIDIGFLTPQPMKICNMKYYTLATATLLTATITLTATLASLLVNQTKCKTRTP